MYYVSNDLFKITPCLLTNKNTTLVKMISKGVLIESTVCLSILDPVILFPLYPPRLYQPLYDTFRVFTRGVITNQAQQIWKKKNSYSFSFFICVLIKKRKKKTAVEIKIFAVVAGYVNVYTKYKKKKILKKGVWVGG